MLFLTMKILQNEVEEEVLEEIPNPEEAVEKGTDFQVIAANLDSYRIKLGNVTFDIKACKSNSGNSSISQPNL